METTRLTVTPEVRESMRQEALAWAQQIRTDLQAWGEKNNLNTFSEVARRLGYQPRESGLRTVSNASGIATDTEVYAVIFHLTGIKSADPRTIPPKTMVRPDKDFTVLPQAWSEERWSAWSQQRAGAGVGTQVVTNMVTNHSLAARVSSLELQLATMANGAQIDSSTLWDLLLAPIVERLAQRVRSELGTGHQDSAIDPMSSAIEELLGLLKPVVEGSRAGRDMFAKQYGREAAELGTLLTALVHPNAETREVMIEYRRQGA